MSVDRAQSPDMEETPNPEYIEVLKRLFGHTKFRPLQWKIIHSIMEQKRDNCAIMSTGYGKSLCYQFPSVYSGGVTLIVSPLISLMEDQVLAMKIANISACLLGTANTSTARTLAAIKNNEYRLVYLTPEFCTGDVGLELLREWYQVLSITLIAIDEAHCVSSWGHDFRFQYRKLGILREIMPTVPILAVTATATEKVQRDIISTLKLKNPQVLCSSLDRPNLYFAVNLKSGNIMADLKSVMEKHQDCWKFSGPTIMYCLKRQTTEEISYILDEMGVKSMAYHAGLSLSSRKQIHEKFVKDRIDVVVATIAFGMGIDKPDVRNVIHYGISSSIEGYYQEAGRAGRDGLPAKCIAFYDGTDFTFHRYHLISIPEAQKERKEQILATIKEYVDTVKCRRQYILNYFGESHTSTPERPDCCDICIKNATNPDNEVYEGIDSDGKYDFTDDARMYLKALEILQGRYGHTAYIAFLRGSKKKQVEAFIKNPLHGAGKNKSEVWWKEIGKLLIKFKYAASKASSYNSFVTLVDITPAGKKFLHDQSQCIKDSPTLEMRTCLKTKANIWVSKSSSTSQMKVGVQGGKVDLETSVAKEKRTKLYNMLLKKRLDLASIENCMPYMIASNKALMDMAEVCPTTLEEITNYQFDGFTTAKVAKYGEAFVKIIKEMKIETAQQKKSIEEILINQPLSELPKLGSSAAKSYLLFKSGKSVEEIATVRGFVASTIQGHLCDCIKFGYAVKLSQLGIIKDDVQTIIKAAENATDQSLMTIKMVCPEDITYNQIKAVVAYLQVRKHLRTLGIPYEEFEDCNYFQLHDSNPTETTDLSLKENNINVEESGRNEKLSQFIRDLENCNEHDSGDEKEKPPSPIETENSPCKAMLDNEDFPDDDLAAFCDQLESNFNNPTDTSDSTIIDDDEPSVKRSKRNIHSLLDSPKPEMNYTILDSPPWSSVDQKIRINSTDSNKKVEYISSDDENVTETPENPPKKVNSNVKLPPWLMHKKVT